MIHVNYVMKNLINYVLKGFFPFLVIVYIPHELVSNEVTIYVLFSLVHVLFIHQHLPIPSPLHSHLIVRQSHSNFANDVFVYVPNYHHVFLPKFYFHVWQNPFAFELQCYTFLLYWVCYHIVFYNSC
jgi:hypothetical protein